MPNYLIRVQLPDRPGALGAVASRIGSVGGDVVSIDILQRDNGAVVDELGVGLAGDHLLGLLRDEILEVDGVSIEALRPVEGALPDRHAELLDIATELFVQTSPDALLDHLAARVQRSLVADFVAIVDADTTRVDEQARRGARGRRGAGHGAVGGRPDVTAGWRRQTGCDGADPSPGWPPPNWCGPASSWWSVGPRRSSGPASASGSPSWPSWPTTAGASWPDAGQSPSGRTAQPRDRSTDRIQACWARSATTGSASGVKAASADHRAARSSSDPHTPSASPAMVAAPSAVVSTDCGTDHLEAGLVGQVLEEQAHDGGAAVHPDERGCRARGRHGLEHVPDLEAHGLDHGPGQMSPTDAPAEPGDRPAGGRIPLGAAESR